MGAAKVDRFLESFPLFFESYPAKSEIKTLVERASRSVFFFKKSLEPYLSKNTLGYVVKSIF